MIRKERTFEQILEDVDVRLTCLEMAMAALALRDEGELSKDQLGEAMQDIAETSMKVGGFCQ
jgi:hypothetical protein